jgi:hypothetical protein
MPRSIPTIKYHAREQEPLQTLADEGLSVVLAYPILLEAVNDI